VVENFGRGIKYETSPQPLPAREGQPQFILRKEVP